MQNVVFEEPYSYVPPHEGNWWPRFIQRFRFIDRYLSKNEGVEAYECRDEHLLAESLSAAWGGGTGVSTLRDGRREIRLVASLPVVR